MDTNTLNAVGLNIRGHKTFKTEKDLAEAVKTEGAKYEYFTFSSEQDPRTRIVCQLSGRYVAHLYVPPAPMSVPDRLASLEELMQTLQAKASIIEELLKGLSAPKSPGFLPHAKVDVQPRQLILSDGTLIKPSQTWYVKLPGRESLKLCKVADFTQNTITLKIVGIDSLHHQYYTGLPVETHPMSEVRFIEQRILDPED